eukprot:TRINITY_DN8010_c0_g1_i4.p1 TRINITY_DN8010_c0_g1~~TRINITY_DN8010_c0_g1_i4.p1  ORF type:complete len:535 (-),score=142.38 TRINITY_DN8010_c0_g1_i4:814-2418(-)
MSEGGRKVKFSCGLQPSDPTNSPVLIIGQNKYLSSLDFNLVKPKFGGKVSKEIWTEALSKLNKTTLDSVKLYLNQVTLTSLPAKVSRHNTPSRSHFISKTIKALNPACENVLILCEREHVYAAGCAVARCFPHYNRKTGEDIQKASANPVNVEFLVGTSSGSLVSPDLSETEIKLLEESSYAIQLTARIVDTPTNEMHTDAFVAEAKKIKELLESYPVDITVIRGEELRERGFGGIYGVGKAAEHPPSLIVLKYNPENAKRNIAWVGKGIVYDTGGLSMKTKLTMPGMKHDCGGAAAVLGAFYLAVKSGFQDNLYGLMCMAENSVSERATRPDDVHTMYSGKTVEINNTDAEGRLVLADGVAYAKKDLNCQIILDICTLTGAQGIATGRYHASHLSNQGDWEEAVSEAGRASGDLSFPAVYCPEFQYPEFNSVVADMKNSVCDRSNAQPSCAGLFINSHLGFDWDGVWIHVDMAAPSAVGERATGYGVTLLNTLFAGSSANPMLKKLAPPSGDNHNANGNESSPTTEPKRRRLN